MPPSVYPRKHVTRDVLVGNTIVKTAESGLGGSLAETHFLVAKACWLHELPDLGCIPNKEEVPGHINTN
jgi:hypothetical protein